MADDGNVDKGADRHSPGGKLTNEPDPSTPTSVPKDSSATPDQASLSAPPELQDLEKRVLGAVRQVVTDVAKEGRRPSDLPEIDMDFVAGPRATSEQSASLASHSGLESDVAPQAPERVDDGHGREAGGARDRV